MRAGGILAVVVALAGCPKPNAPPMVGTGSGSGSGPGTGHGSAEDAGFGVVGDSGDTGSGGSKTPPPAPSSEAKTIANGVIKEVIAPGSGGTPAVGNDRVTVRYRSWSPDLDLGTMPEFVGELPKLPSGVTEAVATMTPGEKARIWVPAVDIHGQDAAPLVVDIELVSIQAAPAVPKDVGPPPKDAIKIQSSMATGMAMKVLTKGTGNFKPTPFDEVVVSFTAWDGDGYQLETTEFDYGTTRQWTVNWFGGAMQDALTTMVAGEKARFWIPIAQSSYADGSDGWVTMDIDVKEVHQKVHPPPVPKDVAKPPKSAKKTKLGTYYKFLKRGKSKQHPGPQGRVMLHYTGWTTDGRMFDSTTTYNSSPVFTLDSVIAGWTDVLQLMAPGDTVRTWIPEALAYKDRYGGPKGMLVYEIELVEIEP